MRDQWTVSVSLLNPWIARASASVYLPAGRSVRAGRISTRLLEPTSGQIVIIHDVFIGQGTGPAQRKPRIQKIDGIPPQLGER